MGFTFVPSVAAVYPAASSNTTGKPTQQVYGVDFSNYGAPFTVTNPAPSIISVVNAPPYFYVSYLAPLPTAGVPIALTVTNGFSTDTYHVLSYGPLVVTGTTSTGGQLSSITVNEPGYAGVFTASVTSGPGSITPSSSTGPTETFTLSGVSGSTVTINDNHGGVLTISTTAGPPSVTVSPPTAVLYPASSSNTGNAQMVITAMQMGNTGGYTAVSSNPGVVQAAVAGNQVTLTYVGPETPAGTGLTVTITGDGGQSVVVPVSAYGPMNVSNVVTDQMSVSSFSITEPGYAGNFSVAIDSPVSTLSATSVSGPSATITVTPERQGGANITITDDHGSTISLATFNFPGLLPVVRPNPVGYPTAGVWFDFLHKDKDGLPAVGEIRGMPVNGAFAMRGPFDFSDFVWGSGASDLIGEFGQLASDFNQPITTTFAGKSDFYEAELGEGGPDSVKTVDNVAIMLSVPTMLLQLKLVFIVTLVSDFYAALQSFGESAPTFFSGSGAIVGQAVVGQAVVGAPNAPFQYQVLRSFAQDNVRGSVIQIGVSETSVYPWQILGYVVRLNAVEATIG